MSIFSWTPQWSGWKNHRYLVHKSILKKSVARAVCLCSPQLQLGQLHVWCLESFESLFSNVSACWCLLLVGTLAGADSRDTHTWTPGSHCGPSPPQHGAGFQGSDPRDITNRSCVALWEGVLEFTWNLFQHILFIRSKALMLTRIRLFLCNEYFKIYGHI